MEWFIIGYLFSEAEKQEKDLGSTYYASIVSRKETKMDRWFKKHPLINKYWPWLVGIPTGMSPLLISMLLLWMAGAL